MKTLLIISALIITSKAFALDMAELTSLDFSKDNQEVCSTDNLIKNDTSKLFAKRAVKINNIHDTVVKVAKELDINPCIILSMIAQESAFDAKAKSGVGAKGLMQVMPDTKAYILNKLVTKNGKKIESNYVVAKRIATVTLISKAKLKKVLATKTFLTKAELENIVLGTYYASYLLKKFDNNTDHAIMAYNMGSGWVNRKLNAKVVIGNDNKHLNKVNANMVLVSLN